MTAWDLNTRQRVPGFKSDAVPNVSLTEWNGTVLAAGLSADILWLDPQTGRTLAAFSKSDNSPTKIVF